MSQSFSKKESVNYNPIPFGHLYMSKPITIVGVNKRFEITGRIL